ncbi:hypothetical protein K8Z49_36580 [Actinomadura madurae]
MTSPTTVPGSVEAAGVRPHVPSGCGHWTMIERTEDFLAAVRALLG